jgi:hypothetical protein
MQAHTKKIFSRMRKYEKNNFLEQYAIFMGQVQIVELLLKQFLIKEKKYKVKKLETTTLGGIKAILKKEGANNVVITLLEELVAHRNYLAHEFLANRAMFSIILGEEAGDYKKPYRELTKALFSVEQMLINLENVSQKA